MRAKRVYESYEGQREVSKLVDDLMKPISKIIYKAWKKDPGLQNTDDLVLKNYMNYYKPINKEDSLLQYLDRSKLKADNNGKECLWIVWEPEGSGISASYFRDSSNIAIFTAKEYLIRGIEDLEDLIKRAKADPDSYNLDQEKEAKYYYNVIEEKLSRVEKEYLLHELQHAVDDWKSNGKVFTSKRYQKYTRNSEDLMNQSIPEPSKDYLRLESEVNARFTQALSKTLEWFEWEKKNREKTPTATDFIEQFQREMYNWEELTDKQKKIVTRKVSSYWHKREENES